MSKKIIIVPALWAIVMLYLAFGNPTVTHACDNCHMYEYSTIQNKTFLGVFYRQRMFNGYAHLSQPHAFAPPLLPGGMAGLAGTAGLAHEPEQSGFMADRSVYDYERYESWELRANWAPLHWLNLTAVLPYEQNTVYYGRVLRSAQGRVYDSTMQLQGLGDLTLAADAVWLKYTEEGRHTLRPGIAVQLPTGRANFAGPEGEAYHPLLQPGGGSYDVALRLSYQYFKHRTGFNAGASYMFSGLGRQGYRRGNSVNLGAGVFHKQPVGPVALVPRLGGYFEQAKPDAFLGETEALTGGWVAFGTLGLDVNWNQLTLRTEFQQPLAERRIGGQVGNAGRLNMGLVFSLQK